MLGLLTTGEGPSQARSPVAQLLPPPTAQNTGPTEEVATWSPVDSSEETEKAAIMFPSAGLSPSMEGTQGRKERGKARGLSWGSQRSLSGPGAFHASLCGRLPQGFIEGRI